MYFFKNNTKSFFAINSIFVCSTLYNLLQLPAQCNFKLIMQLFNLLIKKYWTHPIPPSVWKYDSLRSAFSFSNFWGFKYINGSKKKKKKISSNMVCHYQEFAVPFVLYWERQIIHYLHQNAFQKGCVLCQNYNI